MGEPRGAERLRCSRRIARYLEAGYSERCHAGFGVYANRVFCAALLNGYLDYDRINVFRRNVNIFDSSYAITEIFNGCSLVEAADGRVGELNGIKVSFTQKPGSDYRCKKEPKRGEGDEKKSASRVFCALWPWNVSLFKTE